MALNGLFCADVPLRNYSLAHSVPATTNRRHKGRIPVNTGGLVAFSALEVIFNVMRSINPRFTYLLTKTTSSGPRREITVSHVHISTAISDR